MHEPVTPPAPVLPDFDGACLTRVIPAIFGALDGSPPAGSWVPEPLAGAQQVVLLVVDGFGWEQLQACRASIPVIASGVGGPLTSVAPSTTASALTSLTTGLPPAVHGIVGYRMLVGGRILNVLQWRLGVDDARVALPAAGFQPFPPFPRRGSASVRGPMSVVSRTDYATTAFSAIHLGDATLYGVHTPSGIVPEVVARCAAGDPFVYAYHDGIDRVAHARGLGDHYAAELRALDRLVGDLLDALPPGVVLALTADHGQVEVGSSVEVLDAEIMAGVRLLSGEGRFRMLHVRPGAADDVLDAARDRFGGVAWVKGRDELIDEGWLGGEPVPAVVDRLGEVALVPFAPTAFLDPADTREQSLVARHGSLTSAEMYVPFVAWAAR